MPRGIFVRTEDHNRRVSKGLRKFHRKRREQEEKDKKATEEKKELNSVTDHGLQIKNLDREGLLDKLTETRIEIDRRIRLLAGDFKALSDLQNLQERIEVRLAETGMRFRDKG